MDNKHDEDNLSVVKVFYRDKQAGMYYARLVGNCSVVLRHGAISFPVGTALTIQFRRLAKRRFTRKQAKAGACCCVCKTQSDIDCFETVYAAAQHTFRVMRPLWNISDSPVPYYSYTLVCATNSFWVG